MDKDKLTARQNAIHKGMPKYWDCKLVEKIWEDVVSQDAIMVDTTNCSFEEQVLKISSYISELLKPI